MKQYSVGKWLMWVVVVLLPAIAVGLSNKKVFPSSFWLATILLAVSVCASAIILYYADKADPSIGWYCVVVEGLLSITIFINLGSHFQLSREIDESITITQDRHAEEDRSDLRRKEQSQKYQDCLEEFGRLQRNLPAKKRSGEIPCQQPQEPASLAKSKQVQTRESVLESWNEPLTWLAFLEAGIAILGGFGLGIAWRIDRDKNGVPDWIERQAKRMPKKEFEQTYPRYAGKNLRHSETEISEQNLDEPQSPSPRIVGFNRNPSAPKSVPEIVPFSVPENIEKTRPLAVRIYGAKTGQKTGQDWIKIQGHLLPLLNGVRWQGRRKRKTIECWTKDEQQSYLGLLNEEILKSLSTEKPERKKQILALVEQWKNRP